jgi:ribose 5-phosphate isomerase A
LFLHTGILLSINEIKQRAGEEAAKLVQPGMVIGIGSGSTVFYFIEALAKRIRTGFDCVAVPTSLATLSLSGRQGIKMTQLNDIPSIDITIDGADEIDSNLQLIKGGGGALLQEKMVAAASKQLVVIADNGKLKNRLGEFPLPVEIIPYGWKPVQEPISGNYSIKAELRMKEGAPYITDHGHYILDCHFQNITDPISLNTTLHLIPGVVETGLFIDLCKMALIGFPDGTVQRITKTEN